MQATSQAFVQAGCRAVLRTPGPIRGVRFHWGANSRPKIGFTRQIRDFASGSAW
jgi:hypothetical protein